MREGKNKNMKKFVWGFISALAAVGLVYMVFVFPPQLGSKKKGALYDNDVKKAHEAVLCDSEQHSCSYFDKVQDSGNLNVVVTAAGVPMKGLEVDAAGRPGAPRYYVKLTDDTGVALFNGLPTGSYVIYFNGVNFPKEYGDAPTVPAMITKEQTTERRIDLVPKQ